MKTEVKMGLTLGVALLGIVGAAYYFGREKDQVPARPDPMAGPGGSAAIGGNGSPGVMHAIPAVDTFHTPQGSGPMGASPTSSPTTIEVFVPSTGPSTAPATTPMTGFGTPVGTGTTPGAMTDWNALVGTGAKGSPTGSGMIPGGMAPIGPRFVPGGRDTGMTGTGMTGTATAGAGMSTPGSTYTVKPGDTFSKISTALYGDPNFWSKIAAANPGVSSSHLKVGQTLKVPAAADVKPTPSDLAPKTPANGSSLAPDPSTQYSVVAGDTLEKIAKKLYGNSARWEEIYNLNKAKIGESPTKLRIGMVLKLPAAPKSTATTMPVR